MTLNPSVPPDLADLVAHWTRSVSTPPLPLTTVPGTTDDERRNLAALGGLAGALAGERIRTWPKPMQAWASGEEPPDSLVRRVATALKGDAAFLARVYEVLVAGRSRRRLGTFFTPQSVVEFMLDRAEAVGGKPAVVVDPGAGVGAFSLAARKRWPKARVVAVDVNLVTLGLLGVAEDAVRVDLELGDFLRYAASGPPSDAPRLWIGNPPYTRHHDLAAELKEGARAAYEGLIWSRRAGLSSYFLAATMLNRRPTDTIAYLLPGTWLDTSYGEPLRSSVMTSGAAEIEMHGFDTDVALFPGTRVAAMALVVGPNGAESRLSSGTARLTGSRVLSAATHTDAVDPGRPMGIHVWPRKKGSVSGGVQLGDLVRVRRGVATGANRYFFLTAEEADGFPPDLLHRAILRLRGIDHQALTESEHDALRRRGDRVWLLRIGTGDVADKHVKEWIARAERDGINRRYLCASREPWYAL